MDFLTFLGNALQVSATDGLIYGLMVLGVYITFRILDFPDLTVDGSFPLGAVVFAALVTSGVPAGISMLVAFFAGALAGVITASIHNYLKVTNLLAGILTMTMLYSINIRITAGKVNIPLVRNKVVTVFSDLRNLAGELMSSDVIILIFCIIFVFAIKTIIDLFFRTDLGISIGAMGNNPQMVISSGVNPDHLKTIGLALSNGLVALSGSLAAQQGGFADVGMGGGIIVAGLASVMIGEFVLKSNRIFFLTLRVLIGSIIFRLVIFVALSFGFDIGLLASDNRLINGILIITLLWIVQQRDKRKNKLLLQKINVNQNTNFETQASEVSKKGGN